MERILDAAAQVFVEAGYEAATTEAIAARAGTSIGSLYQFFPNKEALFDAMSTRYLGQAETLFEQLLTPEVLDVPWAELLDRLLDAFRAFHRATPAFRAVWVNLQLSPAFVAAGVALNARFAERVQLVLARQAKGLPRARRPLVATMIVEVASAMLLTTLRHDEATAAALVAETKVLLRRYLRPYMRNDRRLTSRPAAASPSPTGSRASRRRSS